MNPTHTRMRSRSIPVLAAVLLSMPFAHAARPQKLFSCETEGHGVTVLLKWYNDGKGTLALQRDGNPTKTCQLRFGSFTFQMEPEGPVMKVGAERGDCDPKLTLREKLTVQKNIQIRLSKLGSRPDAHASLNWHTAGSATCQILYYNEKAITQVVKRWGSSD